MSTYKTSAAKETILKKIRMALQEEQVAKPFPEIGKPNYKALFNIDQTDDLATTFATSFSEIGGKFIFCNDIKDFVNKLNDLVQARAWNHILCAQQQLFSYLVSSQVPYVLEMDPKRDEAPACITDCELAIARTGSFIFSSQQNFGRIAPIYFPTHIVVLQPHQVVADVNDALKLMRQKYNNQLPSMINLNTGPSRTADIEKTLVTGVHGPKEIYCFWINQ